MKSLTDNELLEKLGELLRQSRRIESDLIAHIAEVDERRLYAREGSSSMFSYCTEVLHLSEAEAYLRIGVARASRRHPVLLEMLGDGRLHLSGIALLSNHLTDENREAVLARATYKTKRAIEELVAELAPKPDVPATIRKLPTAPTAELRLDGFTSSPQREPRPPQAPRVPTVSPRPEPLSPDRHKVQFTASGELREKLERLQALMHCDLAGVIETSITEKLERLEAARFAKAKVPRKALAGTEAAGAARNGTTSSSTTTVPIAAEATTASRTFASSAPRITGTTPSATTVRT